MSAHPDKGSQCFETYDREIKTHVKTHMTGPQCVSGTTIRILVFCVVLIADFARGFKLRGGGVKSEDRIMPATKNRPISNISISDLSAFSLRTLRQPRLMWYPPIIAQRCYLRTEDSLRARSSCSVSALLPLPRMVLLFYFFCTHTCLCTSGGVLGPCMLCSPGSRLGVSSLKSLIAWWAPITQCALVLPV